MQKEIWKIDANRLMYKQRVCLDNKTKAHKNKKRHRNKYKCRSKINPRNWGFFYTVSSPIFFNPCTMCRASVM